ncbi:hypothetical protein [Paraburkholderia xenovorans]|uniref:hypothetical protein n=1 Tax=Paraburkholderia xenovorans TaxID=36873 RepID=UPI0038BD8624
MPTRPDRHGQATRVVLAKLGALAALSLGVLAGCASTPAEPVPFKPVPAARIVQPGYTEPGTGLVAVDVRRERALRPASARLNNSIHERRA